MNENPVLGLESNVVLCIALQRLGQIHVDYFQLAVAALAKDLRIRQQRIASRSAGQINRVTKVGNSIRQMVSGIPYLSGHCNHRRIFEVKSSKDANDIEWLQYQILIFARERISQIEGEHHGREVRLGQADDLSVIDGGFGQKILGRLDQLSD